MKKNRILPLMLMLAATPLLAQQFNLSPSTAPPTRENWKEMSSEQRRKMINSMAPEERASLLREFRESMMISELNISPEKQDAFKNLYAEYQQKQKEIKNRFQYQQDPESLSDEQAHKQLHQSFEVGQMLLNNRKEYSGKFMKIISPQQVLKMYETEGAIRNKMMDMKDKGGNNPRKRNP